MSSTEQEKNEDSFVKFVAEYTDNPDIVEDEDLNLFTQRQLDHLWEIYLSLKD